MVQSAHQSHVLGNFAGRRSHCRNSGASRDAPGGIAETGKSIERQ